MDYFIVYAKSFVFTIVYNVFHN